MARSAEYAAVLRPLILSVVSSVPVSTTEIVSRIENVLRSQGAEEDIRGVIVRFPSNEPCSKCGTLHSCYNSLPLGSGIIKPQLDALAKVGLVTKYSRGNARAALWTLAIEIPDTLDEWLGSES